MEPRAFPRQWFCRSCRRQVGVDNDAHKASGSRVPGRHCANALCAIPKRGKSADGFELGKTRSVLVYDEEELRAFIAELETKTYKPAVAQTPTDEKPFG